LSPRAEASSKRGSGRYRVAFPLERREDFSGHACEQLPAIHHTVKSVKPNVLTFARPVFDSKSPNVDESEAPLWTL